LLSTARHAGSVRDRALLALLCGTGLRLAEAAALDVADVPTTEAPARCTFAPARGSGRAPCRCRSTPAPSCGGAQ